MHQNIRLAPVLILAAATLFVGCELDFADPPTREATKAEFGEWTQMVGIGNSLTAGFQGGGIQERGQRASFFNLVHQSLLGREAQSPWVDWPGIGSEIGQTPLFIDPVTGGIVREPLGATTTQLAINSTFPRPYDNLAIPGITTAGINRAKYPTDTHPNGATIGNGLFDLILRNIPQAPFPEGTVVDQARRVDPDIMTIWSGNNEILGGSLSGSPQDTDASLGSYIWPISEFEPEFLALCDSIEAMGPEMVVFGNVPDIAIIPYLTFRGLGTTPFNRFHMEEDYADDCPTEDCVEYLLLPSPIGTDNATNFLRFSCDFTAYCDTVGAEFTLTTNEVQLISDRIAAYNQIIERETTNRGWGMVDVYTALRILPNSPRLEGQAGAELNRAFPWILVNPIAGIFDKNTHSAFTLDGIHPSEKGHAQIANAFLAEFEATYGISYTPYDLADFYNLAGFERLEATELDTGQPAELFGESGLEALQALPEMFRARF